VSEGERAASLAAYAATYRAAFTARMRAKLGLLRAQDDDGKLIADLLGLLAAEHADYTRFFRALCDIDLTSSAADDRAAELFGDRDGWYAWQQRYRARLAAETTTQAERRAAKRQVNPKYVLRNHLAQVAIERAQTGDFAEIARLHDVLRRPFDEQPENEPYAGAPPDWARDISISCSS
jgi:uncharacterized protein YdiU (UPF0061 family)